MGMGDQFAAALNARVNQRQQRANAGLAQQEIDLRRQSLEQALAQQALENSRLMPIGKLQEQMEQQLALGTKQLADLDMKAATFKKMQDSGYMDLVLQDLVNKQRESMGLPTLDANGNEPKAQDQTVGADHVRQTLFGSQPASLQGVGIPSMDFGGRTNAGDRGLSDLLSSVRPAPRTRLAAAVDFGLDPAGEDFLAALLKANGGTLQPELAAQLAQQIANSPAMSSKPSSLADTLFGSGGPLAPVEPRQSGRNLNLPPGFLEEARRSR